LGCVAHEGVVEGVLKQDTIRIQVEHVPAHASKAAVRRVSRDPPVDDGQATCGITGSKGLSEKIQVTLLHHPSIGQGISQCN
jgi:hypothetical protein